MAAKVTWAEIYQTWKSATILLGQREVEENGPIQGGGKWKSPPTVVHEQQNDRSVQEVKSPA